MRRWYVQPLITWLPIAGLSRRTVPASPSFCKFTDGTLRNKLRRKILNGNCPRWNRRDFGRASSVSDRKGKVESGAGHAQKTPLKGLRFATLEAAQTYLDHREEKWAETRIHGTTKRQVAAMFAEDCPALLPPPIEPFRYYQYRERTVHLDGCVEVETAYYGALPGWIGRRIQVHTAARTAFGGCFPNRRFMSAPVCLPTSVNSRQRGNNAG